MARNHIISSQEALNLMMRPKSSVITIFGNNIHWIVASF
jgi:hypothetical protein